MMRSNVRLPFTPPSLNAIAGRSNRFAFSRAKKQWQRDLGVGLMALGVPRNLNRVEASAVLTFTTNRRRDEGNFRVLLEKALGDALVEGRWLDDDTPDHYRFGAVDFALRDSPGTALTLLCETAGQDTRLGPVRPGFASPATVTAGEVAISPDLRGGEQ